MPAPVVLQRAAAEGAHHGRGHQHVAARLTELRELKVAITVFSGGPSFWSRLGQNLAAKIRRPKIQYV